jgi:filamentous hemagglutinin
MAKITRKRIALKRLIVWGLILNLLMPPWLLMAADRYIPGMGFIKASLAPPAAHQLPEPLGLLDADMAVLEKPSADQLVVHQKQDKVLIDWKSFDIGADASTHFDQQGRTDWTAVNRIWDKNPSQIFGRLSADGKVFLINQNGMIFGPHAQVQAHQLVASALNIDWQKFFDDGSMIFTSEDYIGDPDHQDWPTAVVENQGGISADRTGAVYLLAPNVKNSGTIDAPAGIVVLMAANGLELEYASADDTRRGPRWPAKISEGQSNEVLNQGRITADTGEVNLLGRVVNQDGVIRSVTSVDSGGSIWLKATERVTTGKDSRTACDISESAETLNRSADIAKGEIRVEAPMIVHQGTISAPSGTVALTAEYPKADVIVEGSGTPQDQAKAPTDDQMTRIYLAEGSVIDVSGKIVDLAAQDRVSTMQLNSVQLRDDYGQKDGDGLLKGATIAVDTRRGSAIGNVSEAITNQLQTAQQKNVAGGTITLTVPAGDIVQCQGAALKFNGGRTNYAAGPAQTTKLVAGRQVYDISEAPQWLQYDHILGSWEKRYRRFGIVEHYDGSYFGGSGPVMDLSPAYSEGADAGRLELMARRVALDGALEGYTYVGPYQTRSEELKDLNDAPVTAGLARPVGSQLILGNMADVNRENLVERDLYLNEILLTAGREMTSTHIGTDDPLPDANQFRPEVTRADASLVSADLLSGSGVEDVEIYANYRVATQAGADLHLPVGGKFSVTARSIEHQGSIEATHGTVNLTAQTLKSSLDTGDPLADDGFNEGIFLGAASHISVAGADTDYTRMAPGVALEPAHPDQATGGEIHLVDANFAYDVNDPEFQQRRGLGVMVAQGAHLDVSGGYTISTKGQLTPGNAGTLDLTGTTLVLDGEMAGRSLVGGAGGTLELHARQVDIRTRPADAVAFDAAWNIDDPERLGKLLLAPLELADTGFSQLTISSEDDLTVRQGVSLTPSYARRTAPPVATGSTILPGYYSQSAFVQNQAEGLVHLPPEMVAKADITLKAGKVVLPGDDAVDNKRVVVSRDAQVVVAPGGTITLDAQAVEIAGRLEARGGGITIDGKNSLILEDGARLDVSGTLIPGAKGTLQGSAALSTPMNAGAVALSAVDIDLRSGSQIDISGSAPADYYLRQRDNTLGVATTAGYPGSLGLEYAGTLQVNGDILAMRSSADQPGAGLTIHRTFLDEGLAVNDIGLRQIVTEDGEKGLVMLGAGENHSMYNGFDALTLQSDHSLTFGDDLDLRLDRQLVLDAPTIAFTGPASQGRISLQAPWVTLTNTSDYVQGKTALQIEANTAQLALNAAGDKFGWLDVTGSVRLAGFQQAYLQSAGDMVLDDHFYALGNGSGNAEISGELGTTGELHLTAAQIYPATAADFRLSAQDAQGKIVVKASGDASTSDPLVYSAGGRLVLQAPEIQNFGRLMAPAGQIVLCNGMVEGSGGVTYTPAERVYLAPGSLISTKGADFKVNYGNLSDPEVQSSWSLSKGSTVLVDHVAAAPDKNTVISADEIIVAGAPTTKRQGAAIDASGGGGEVFAYGWLPGAEGSVDPLDLAQTGRMVILPGTAAALPGEAVYLKGGAGLEAGVYTLLPAKYAFLPGAMILEERGASQVDGFSGRTVEGYATVQGYRTVAGTGVRSGRLTDYIVRPAEDVRAQGHYTLASYGTGAGGTVSLSGRTTILAGTIRGSGVEGMDNGTLELSGTQIDVQAQTDNLLGAGFDPDASLIPAGADGHLTVAAGGGGTPDADSIIGFDHLRIGKVLRDDKGSYTADSTQTISIGAGTQLTARNLELAALGSITIQGAGASAETLLRADGDHGTITLTSPTGAVVLDAGARLDAASKIVFDAPNLSLDGDLHVQNSTIALSGSRITFAAAAGDAAQEGLTITPGLWDKIKDNETVELLSRSDVLFNQAQDDVPSLWQTGGTLLIDAARIANAAGGPMDVTLGAQTIQLLNTSSTAGAEPGAGGGNLLLQAGNIEVGHGDLRIEGFDTVALTAASSAAAADRSPSCITFLGRGSLSTDAGLTLTADAVRTDLFRTLAGDGTRQFEAANFTVTAATRIAVAPGAAGAALDYSGLPGSLAMEAQGIDISGAIVMPAGDLALTAGDGGINLADHAELYLAGDTNFSGGALHLESQGSGDVVLGADARINLDAGTRNADGSFVAGLQGDAGSLNITVAGGAISLAGALSAAADGGDGGSFALDAAQQIANLDTLLGMMQGSGFTRTVAVRTRSGDLSLGEIQPVVLTAGHIRLAAAGGDLKIGNATLTADGQADGGLIELYAQKTMTIGAGAQLSADAGAAGGNGGRIYAASAGGIGATGNPGTVTMVAGARLSVRGGDDGSGGAVHFRALRDDATGNPGMVLAGTIDGASRVTAEAVRIYDGGSDTNVYAGGDIGADNIGKAMQQADSFLQRNTAWQPPLKNSAGENVAVALVPGIEFHSTAATTTIGGAQDIDLGALGAPATGTLAIRAAGDLALDTRLYDRTGGWDLLLAAGADLAAVDRLATSPSLEPGGGVLSLNKELFSQAGDVAFAAAGDTIVAGPGVNATPMITGTGTQYSLASFSGAVTGRVGGDLNLRQGIIQTGTGAIDLAVAGDVNFTDAAGGTKSENVRGAIRTVGTKPDDVHVSNWWLFEQPGGSIQIQAGGRIDGAGLMVLKNNSPLTAWDAIAVDSRPNLPGNPIDKTPHLTADYNNGTQGIATMAGGDVSVSAGGDIVCQVGTFGMGNLAVRSGGDIGGRFLVRGAFDGDHQVRTSRGDLTALGNIGMGSRSVSLELCDVAAFNALAVGAMELDSVVNPTALSRSGDPLVQPYWTYSQGSRLVLTTMEGDIRLLGNHYYYPSAIDANARVLPPILDLLAAAGALNASTPQSARETARPAGDIYLGANLETAASPQANIRLVAPNGTIAGDDPEGSIMPGGITMQPADFVDNEPVIIAAGGNIENLALFLPKQALIDAGQDIVDLQYAGRNLNAGDFSLIHAGRDLRLGVNPLMVVRDPDSQVDIHNTYIKQGGPGTLLVQAGRTLDLGTSYGIEAVGNADDPDLPDQSARLVVAAGYDLLQSFAGNTALDHPGSLSSDLYGDGSPQKITAGLSVLFDQLRESGRFYSQLLAEERQDEAEAFVDRFRQAEIYPHFALLDPEAAEDQGDINMINSKIKTVDSSAGIYIITAGDLNVGRSTISVQDPNNLQQKTRESGIFTESGGGVNIFAAGKKRAPDGPSLGGDINVNESRIMTFLGGDVTVWADQGDINAGRGSKGALILPIAEVIQLPGGDRIKKSKPPVLGSGIRTLTYDPDGPDGPAEPAKAGDGYIFAPQGEIDAGEAGISVANIFLAATKYANVQNIEVAGVSVGVPVMAEVAPSIDAMTGDSSISEAIQNTTQSVTGDPSKRMQQMLNSVNDNLVKILNVEVVGFGDTDEQHDKDKDKNK